MHAAEKSMARQLEAMIRFVIMDNGIMASSPTRDSQMKKTTIVPKAPQNSPMTVELSHLYTLPPHSRASRNMIAAGAKRTNPRTSRLFVMERKVTFSLLLEWLGIRMKKRKTATKAPAGRLI
jgi:hypothetical protein